MMMGNDDGVVERKDAKNATMENISFLCGGWWEGRMTWDADVDVGKQ
jgi:hypothetical protein